jgi:hypothetical protein
MSCHFATGGALSDQSQSGPAAIADCITKINPLAMTEIFIIPAVTLIRP